MLASISPLGERARGSQWWRTTTAYLVMSIAGGAMWGTALAAAGSRLPRGAAILVILGAAALAGAAVDLAGRLPTIHRQVNENWLVTYRDWVYGAGFGAQLGFGAVTIVTSAATYLLWVLEALSGSWVTGLVIGATFGLARGLPLLAMSGVHTPEALRAVHRRLQRWARAGRAMAVAVQGIAAGVFVIAAAVGVRP